IAPIAGEIRLAKSIPRRLHVGLWRLRAGLLKCRHAEHEAGGGYGCQNTRFIAHDPPIDKLNLTTRRRILRRMLRTWKGENSTGVVPTANVQTSPKSVLVGRSIW